MNPISKWISWCILAADPKLRPHLPDTAPYTPERLHRFLDRYRGVYVKPVFGLQGYGVTRVWSEGGRYHLHRAADPPLRDLSGEALAARVREAVGPETPCIVQQAISLPQVEGRPFDIRVMVQRGARGAWRCTGMLAKVAGPHSAVTNVKLSRGRVVPVEQAIKTAFRTAAEQPAAVMSGLEGLSLRAARRLAEAGSLHFEAGIDAALGPRRWPWILEVNDNPSHDLFRGLPDRAMWDQIQRTLAEYQQWRLQRWWGGGPAAEAAIEPDDDADHP